MTLRSFSFTGGDIALMALSAATNVDTLTIGRGQGSAGPQVISFYTTTTQATPSPVYRGEIAATGWIIGAVGTRSSYIRHGTSGNLVAGVLDVADANVTANTRIFLSVHTRGTITLPAAYDAATRTAGVKFTITSSNVLDTSTVDYVMIEP